MNPADVARAVLKGTYGELLSLRLLAEDYLRLRGALGEIGDRADGPVTRENMVNISKTARTALQGKETEPEMGGYVRELGGEEE